MVTEERRIEVEQFLARVCAWSLQRPDVVAVALVGSWACGHPGMDSDVDLVVLTTDKPAYLREESWVAELGGTRIIRTQDWGPLYTERRFVLPSGLEVEFGVAPPAWAALDPSIGGLRALHDPEGVLARLIEACRGEA
ncbi:MAG: Nucleotidyltransferase domain protein [Rubrobacteraceae bacterium]|jgi:predicted nucleotidyltransferase|nr:Nucleotidyltransferase domain protein [Rubrobacteraceae bacterium]